MFFQNAVQDTNKTMMSMWVAALENARTAHDTMLKQSEMATKNQFPWQVKWSNGAYPMPVMTFQGASAETTREAFHMMADANLKAWSITAEAYAGMPEWVKMPYKAPGEFWAKWFDQMNKDVGPMPFDFAATAEMQAPEVVVEEAAAAPVPQAELDLGETVAETSAADNDDAEAHKPKFLKAPKGEADDLTLIKGIGKKLSSTLNELGVFHFWQIASWTPENIAWVDENLSFKGRIYREAWVEQAQNFLKEAA